MNDHKRLSQTIFPAMCILWFLAAASWLLVLPPEVTFVGLFNIQKDFSEPEPIYQLGNTTVSLYRGSILSPPVTKGRVSAATYSVKLNLTPPFYETSVDFKLREKLGSKFKAHLIEQQEKDFKLREKDIATKGYWVVDIADDFSIDGAVIFLVAGISAKPKGTDESILLKVRKPKIIRSAISELCSIAANQGIEELFLTVIGTGSAAVDKGKGIDALLSGVNDSAFAELCPKWVTIILWPLIAKADEAKEAQREANWLATGELFRIALTSNSIYEEDLLLWDYRRPWVLASQVFLICSFTFASALVALRRNQLPIGLTFGAVIGKVLKWGVIGAGVTVSQQSFSEIVPLSPANVSLLCLLAFIVPFWDWHKFGEPVHRDKEVGS